MPRWCSLAIFLLSFLVNYCTSLECYVCDNQEDNKGKCVTTILTCDPGEDVCLSEIKWGSTPYWQQGAFKQYYISKRCASKDKCEKYRSSNMASCTHIWYEDWKCSECCKGDRCNYYIISIGSFLHKSSVSVLAGCLIVYKFLI
ncbi:UPAR/Ly6 domain-containing protein cold [Euwallacea similis]|uniref:UPAR/Ly6 domain-containing protein cold n=1 Tax=Euwallacea similis TaxID=1736056 RepID=UPI00344E3784